MTNLKKNTKLDLQQALLSPMAWDAHTTEDYSETPFCSNAGLRMGGYRVPRVPASHGQLTNMMDYATWDLNDRPLGWYVSAVRRENAVSRTETVSQRLAEANGYFRRKASEVVNDESAIRLLAAMYQDVVLDISTFDTCREGLSLAKLAAANFCEIGDKVIYITEAGQRFIRSIKDI